MAAKIPQTNPNGGASGPSMPVNTGSLPSVSATPTAKPQAQTQAPGLSPQDYDRQIKDARMQLDKAQNSLAKAHGTNNQEEIGRWQGEIGRLQGTIGDLTSQQTAALKANTANTAKAKTAKATTPAPAGNSKAGVAAPIVPANPNAAAAASNTSANTAKTVAQTQANVVKEYEQRISQTRTELRNAERNLEKAKASGNQAEVDRWQSEVFRLNSNVNTLAAERDNTLNASQQTSGTDTKKTNSSTKTDAKNTQQTQKTATPQTQVQTQAQPQNTLPIPSADDINSQYQQRMTDSSGMINDLYANQLAAQQAQLKSAYDQNLADLEAARGQIGRNYQNSANDLAIQYERNRRNLNEQAMVNGLNTGTGSQQQLALNQQYLTAFGGLRGQEAQAYTNADMELAKLKTNYQNQIAQAIADNDFKKAAALVDNYNTQQNWLTNQLNQIQGYNVQNYFNEQGHRWSDETLGKTQDFQERMSNLGQQQDLEKMAVSQGYTEKNTKSAQDYEDKVRKEGYAQQDKVRGEENALKLSELLANYGNFSGFGFDKNTQNYLEKVWALQNDPNFAYAANLISPEQYFLRTGGVAAPQYNTGGTGGPNNNPYGMPGFYNDDGTPIIPNVEQVYQQVMTGQLAQGPYKEQSEQT